MLLTAFYFVLSTLAAQCQVGGTQVDVCEPNRCENIKNVEICTQCKSGSTKFPINGVCTTEIDGNTGCSASEKCTQCKEGYFLYKGGCYKFGNDVARLICNDQATVVRSSTVAGVCTECNANGGFFKNPEAAATTDSCIACNDATGVQVSGNTYKGLQNCATCIAPEKGAGSDQKVATCKTCLDGFFGTGTEGVAVTLCTECTGDCKTCKGAAAQCTSCKTNYLKIKDTDNAFGECVTDSDCKQLETYFPTTNGGNIKVCALCNDVNNKGVAGCNKCTSTPTGDPSNMVTVKCTECATPANKPNVAGTGCFTCSIDGCDNCSENGICEKCGSNKKVSPGKSSCIEKCPENSIEKESVCVCNSGYGPDSAGAGCVTVSTNLSTGAIAGISVAAIVVVGGLVGFLCWWFICRGKA